MIEDEEVEEIDTALLLDNIVKGEGCDGFGVLIGVGRPVLVRADGDHDYAAPWQGWDLKTKGLSTVENGHSEGDIKPVSPSGLSDVPA